MREPGSIPLCGYLWVAAQVIVFACFVLVSATAPPANCACWIRLGGLVLIAAGSCLTLAAMWTIGRFLTPLPLPRASAPLQTSGPFAMVRHPIYSGLLVGALGWALWRCSAEVALATGGLGVFFWLKAGFEERRLCERFPEQYPPYAMRVKRLLPWVI